MSTHRVFVYGTLKRGESNHNVLLGAEYLGVGFTKPSEWIMLNLGPFPALVDSHGAFAPPVQGELYLVDDTGLNALDALEGYPDFYGRKSIAVYSRSGLFISPAFVYYMENPPQEKNVNVIESGEW